MSNMLICTGKKKAIKGVLEHFQTMAAQKEIEIIAKKQVTKKMFLWGYEELRILFVSKGKEIKLPQALVRSADYMALKESVATMKMASFAKEDPWLKWGIMAAVAPFRLNGGQIGIEEKVEQVNQYKKKHQVFVVISGPLKAAITCKDMLIKEGLVDPKSLEYLL